MRIYLSILFILLLAGCSGLQIKRDVMDNTFYSSYPRIVIKIDPEFEYADKSIENDFSYLTDTPMMTNITEEKFTFINRKEKRAVVICIQTLSVGYWKIGDKAKGVNLLETDRVSKNGKSYHYSIFTFEDDNLKKCMIVKYLCRTTGVTNNTLLNIYYLGETDDFEFSCKDWKKIKALSQKQIASLQKFKNDSNKHILFMNPDTDAFMLKKDI